MGESAKACITDAELVRRARAGDRDAFGELLTRHQPLMLRLIRRVLGSQHALEDVTQEAALQAWLGLDALRDPRHFGAWLAGIGLNVARRTLSRQSRDSWSLDALLGGRQVAEPVDASAGPEEVIELAELSGTVRAAVADLPAGQRAAVLLVYLSGLTYRETAAVLGVEVGAVKTRLHKSRHHLQRRLRDLWTEDVMTTTTPTSVKQQFVEMRVRDVRRRELDGGGHRCVVVLEEAGGTRQLPIWIGVWEGDSIAMLLEKVQVPRPLTHAFTANLLRAAGVRVNEVRVHRLAQETFYAQVVLDADKTVDARPSDVIALALEMGAPIYVAAEVLDEVIAAQSAMEPSERVDLATAGIGAGEIVNQLIEQWPREPKPTRSA